MVQNSKAISDKLNAVEICTAGSSAQKSITTICDCQFTVLSRVKSATVQLRTFSVLISYLKIYIKVQKL
jgi:hypothetical protein